MNEELSGKRFTKKYFIFTNECIKKILELAI